MRPSCALGFFPNLRIRCHLPATVVNGEEIAFENVPISDSQGLVTLNVTLDRVILHTVMHHSSTSTYIPNVFQIEESFLDVRTGGRAFETHFIRSTLGVDLKCSSWLSVRVTYEHSNWLSRSRLLTLVLQLARTIIGQGQGHLVAYIRITFWLDAVGRSLPRHPFKIFSPLKISLVRLKPETSNLACMLIVASTSLRTTSCPWKGRGRWCHSLRTKNCPW